jgi:hypothetical protein
LGKSQPQANIYRDSSNDKQATSANMASTLLDAVTGTLAQLPERVVTELTQAQVIVDARKSTDNQAVRGTLDRSQPGGPVNAVVAKNARFRTSGVRPGDQIRYFALQTSELIEEYRRGTSSTADISEDMMFELATGNDVGATNYKPIVFPVLEVASETELVTFPLNVAEPTTELFEVQVWRNSSERYTQLQRDLGLYANRGLPRLGWQPSPDRAALEQIVERLNQWLLQGEPDVDWQMPQLLAQLPQALASDAKLARLIDESALTRSAFSVSATDRELLQAAAYEGQLLQEAQWSRDIGRWSGQGATSAPDRAQRLFRWVVGNIQLEQDDQFALPRRPWSTLLFGRGTAENRAWVFAEMCRQRGWTPVVIAVPATAADTADAASIVWCGVEIVDDIYLFDPLLGLTLLADGKPATLRQLRQQPELLRQFDLPNQPYPVVEGAVEQMVAYVVADPFQLSRRAKLLEMQLAGENALRLADNVDRTAQRLARRHDLSRVELWPFPYRVLRDQLNLEAEPRTREAIEFSAFAVRPKLFKARVLHFRGRRELVADADRGNMQADLNDHTEAMALYLDPEVRPSDAVIKQIPAPELREPAILAKVNATYWAGLLSNDRGSYASALDWFDSVLGSNLGKALWAPGAHRNAAIALAATGQPLEAAKRLRSIEGPAAAGNLLLANQFDPPPDAPTNNAESTAETSAQSDADHADAESPAAAPPDPSATDE